MRRPRFSIAGLMGVVLVAAVGLAALRSPSVAWAEHALHGDLRRVRPGHRRGHLPQRRRAGVVARLLRVRIGLPGRGGVHPERVTYSRRCPRRMLLIALRPMLGHPVEFVTGSRSRNALRALNLYMHIGHALWALLAGLLGGTLARIFLARPSDRPEGPGTGGVGDRPADPGSVGCGRRSSPGRAWCWPPPPRRSDPDPMQGPGPARRSS